MEQTRTSARILQSDFNTRHKFKVVSNSLNWLRSTVVYTAVYSAYPIKDHYTAKWKGLVQDINSV